mmetsp:Transcript_44295/g.123214  ORF Transcript_44295/g.123214 Transcript_44295/m.123214 type:complete len:191 (+) Transcript_44295:43-615(+)
MASASRAIGSGCRWGALRAGAFATTGTLRSAHASLGAMGLRPAARRFAMMAPGTPRLRLRGLPFNATVDEVYAFMSGFRLAESGDHGPGAVRMLKGRSRKPTGQAFVYLEDAVEAFKAKDELHLRPWCVAGTRLYRVEVFEDFTGRSLVFEEDEPGDVTEERLRDRMRKKMVGNRHKEEEQKEQVLYRQW